MGVNMSDLDCLIDAARRGATADAKDILLRNPALVNERDESGATALHYAAFEGHCELACLLLDFGAAINARDAKFNATPAGWAIEYLRQRGGLLGIEMNDFAFAIENGHAEWVKRFLNRFPHLKDANDINGVPFRTLARHSTNPEIARLFEGQ